MAEEKKERKEEEKEKEKKYVYGQGEPSHLSRAFRGIFPETWLASEYGQSDKREGPDLPLPKSSSS